MVQKHSGNCPEAGNLIDRKQPDSLFKQATAIFQA